jgi:hypothetical protein
MGSTPQTEHRRSKRFPLESSVTVEAGGVEHKCATRDISTGGAFFYCVAPILQDSPIQLDSIAARNYRRRTATACCHGRVARVEEPTHGQCGVAVKIERATLSPLATA